MTEDKAIKNGKREQDRDDEIKNEKRTVYTSNSLKVDPSRI